jgi:hypothetical protein
MIIDGGINEGKLNSSIERDKGKGVTLLFYGA